MKPERVALLPDWPGRMNDELAARYLGIGLTTFRSRVRRREYPQPVHEGGRKLWAKAQLDRFIANQFGLPVDLDAARGASSGTWDDL